MIKKIIISIFVTLITLSCKKNNEKDTPTQVMMSDDVTNAKFKKKINSIDEDNVQTKQSFTLDCGSGCAMTYNEISKKNNHNSVEIKYKVTQYINEKIEDECFETYIFEIDENGYLRSIHLDNNKENILNDDSSLIRDQLIEVCGKIFDKKSSNQSNLKDSELVIGNKPFKLMMVPFDLKIMLKTYLMKYKTVIYLLKN